MKAKHGAGFSVVAMLILGLQTQAIGCGSPGDVATHGGNHLAMLYSERPNKNDPGGWAAAMSSEGKPFDPGSLLVFLNDLPLVCTDPYGFGEACGTESLVTILLPPALQAVGTYSLSHL